MTRVNISVHKVSFNVYCPDTSIENTWDDISKGLWEPQTLRIISSFIDKTDCALELGIDLGQTTMFTAHFAGKLIAVEPSIDSIKLARKHLELNKHLQNKTILFMVHYLMHVEKSFLEKALSYLTIYILESIIQTLR